MTDLICRKCGEPWDSTGGLHYSHSDLSWWEYAQLVRGVGCPCCEGEPKGDTDTNYTRWYKSVEQLSEGQVWASEKLGDIYWPESLRYPWLNENEYRTSPPEWWRVLGLTYSRRVVHGAEDMRVINMSGNVEDSDKALLYPMDTVHIHPEGDTLSRANWRGVTEEIEGKRYAWVHTLDGFHMVVGYYDGDSGNGRYIVPAESFADHIMQSLDHYPVWSDIYLAEEEEKDFQSQAEGWIESREEELDRYLPHWQLFRDRVVDALRSDIDKAEVVDVVTALAEEFPVIPQPIGWDVFKTIEEGTCFICQARLPKQRLSGIIMRPDGSDEEVDGLPVHHLVSIGHGCFADAWLHMSVKERMQAIDIIIGEED